MIDEHPIFSRYRELKDFIGIMRYEIQRAQRPASEIILDDEAVMKILRILKRSLATMREERKIPFSQEEKGRPCRYLLSDILDYINRYRIESTDNQRKI